MFALFAMICQPSWSALLYLETTINTIFNAFSLETPYLSSEGGFVSLLDSCTAAFVAVHATVPF
jgi:hypothetical protein